jgi:hypothetical protein
VNYASQQQQTPNKAGGSGKPQAGAASGSGLSASAPGTKRLHGQMIDSSAAMDPKQRDIIAP